MNTRSNNQISVFLTTVAIISMTIHGCGPERSQHGILDLTAQTLGDVTLFNVTVAYRDSVYPLGFINHFGHSWAPLPLKLPDALDFEISWQETSESPIQKTVVRLQEPTEAELRKLRGVVLVYSEADGWTARLRLKDDKPMVDVER